MALDKNRRSLNTSFYNDPYIEDLSRNEHDIFLTLLLNPQNNLAGVYEISIKKLAAYSKMDPDDVRKSINKLMDDGKIIYINSWVAIKNHIKNQSINPKMAKNILEILKQVPMQMKVFVLLNDQGELEKWSQKLLDKLEDHYNIKKKAECKREKIEYNPESHGMEYSQEQFLNDINGLDNSNNSNIKAYQSLSNPLISMKEEIRNMKEESEIRNKKEEKGNTGFTGFKPAKTTKHKHGEYKHVLLTDEEYETLKDKVDNRDKWIKILDEAIETKGYKYKNHSLVIQKWYKKETPEDEMKNKDYAEGWDE